MPVDAGEGYHSSGGDQAGNSYVYAARKVDDQTLQFVKGIKGTDVVLTLKKRQ